MDDEARPTEVAPLEVDGEVELRRRREAELRRQNRLAEREQIVGERG
jgi:hypothetical protein